MRRMKGNDISKAIKVNVPHLAMNEADEVDENDERLKKSSLQN